MTGTKNPRSLVLLPALNALIAASFFQVQRVHNIMPRERKIYLQGRVGNEGNFSNSETSEHTNFEESIEIIQPLTEGEKTAKLQELRERLVMSFNQSHGVRRLQRVADCQEKKLPKLSKIARSRRKMRYHRQRTHFNLPY